MIPVDQRSVFYWYDHLAVVCVCVTLVGLEDVIGHIKALNFISFK